MDCPSWFLICKLNPRTFRKKRPQIADSLLRPTNCIGTPEQRCERGTAPLEKPAKVQVPIRHTISCAAAPVQSRRALVATLGETRKRETVRKSLLVLGMVLDFAGITPNVARDKTIKLPREERIEIKPPTAEHVERVLHVLPARYRLPLCVLDATGMRLGELEALTWGDVDESRVRWRVSAAAAKTRHARWVPVPPELFDAVTGLVAREDRTADRRVFQGFGGDRFRTALTRACTAAGVPAFSPHDLRHRRISLLHLAGVPWARIGEHVGQRSLRVTADTYSHVLADECELDYERMLR